MAGTIEINGTGGIIEGNLGSANVNVNLDPVYGNFNGSTSSLSSTDSAFDGIWASNGGFVSAWIFPKSVGETAGRIFDKDKWALTMSDAANVLEFNVVHGTTTGVWKTGAVVPFNAWTHVGVYYDSDATGNDPVIYINGVATTITETATPAGSLTSDASDTFFIGNRADGARTFDGYIMDVKVYKNIAVSATNAGVIASKINVDPNVIGLSSIQLWAKLNASTTADSSGESHTLTASNMGSVVYDEFSVDVYDNSTTTDGTFTVTQGKVECKALSSVDFDGTDDHVDTSNTFLDNTDFTIACWIRHDGTQESGLGSIVDTRQSGSNGVALSNHKTDHIIRLRIGDGGSNDISTANDAVSDNTWHHIVAGRDASNNTFLYLDGVLQASGTSTRTLDSNTGLHIGGAPYTTAAEFGGKIRDVKLFDYGLSAEQAASLYSGTYPQTPSHHYKLDEGSGTTASDTGTATASNGTLTNGPTYSNGTLDLDGTLTIAANGTLSAPRGNLDLANVVFAKNASGTFTHNNGNVKFSTAGGSSITTSDPVLYDLEVNQGGSNLDVTTNLTIEHNLTVTSGMLRPQPDTKGSELTITFGTTSYASQLELDNYGIGFESGGNNTHACALVGASSLYSFKVLSSSSAGIDLDSGGSGSKVKLANIDYDKDITSGGGGVTVTLTGDAEFNAVTVSSGDTLDLNGQRAVMSGLVTLSGDNGLKDTAGGAFLITNGIAPATSTQDSSTSTITYIADGGSNSHKVQHFAFKRFVSTRVGNIDFGRHAPNSSSMDVIAANNGNLSNWGKNGSNDTNFMKNLTIVTGTTAVPESSTLTVAGDFTTSGGLIGKSALDFDGVDDIVNCGSDSSLDNIFDGGGTVEAWIKPDSDGEGNDGRIADKSKWIFNVEAESGTTMKLRLYQYFSGNDAMFSSTDRVITKDKWNHVAVTYDNGSTTNLPKMYVDGKQVALTNAISTTGTRDSDETDDFLIGNNAATSKTFDGHIAMVRAFSDIRTESEIRTDMFNAHANMANTGNLVGMWQFDEGTGTSVDDVSANSNTGTITGASFAGSGTFTPSTSTVVMAKSGTQTIAYNHLDNDFTNLTINAGSTTQLLSIDGTGSLQDINRTLTVNGILKSHPDATGARIRLRGPAYDLTVGSSVKTTALADLARLQIDGNGTFNIPELTTKKIFLTSNNTIVSASGPLTITEELQLDGGTTFNANGNTITALTVDVNGNNGTLDLRNSTLKSFASGGDEFHMEQESTLLTGNTIISGFSAAEKTGFVLQTGSTTSREVVGTLENVIVDGDVTVIGSVINCDFANTSSNIRQFHHTLDTQQLLDADEAGDDDLKLEKPALDNAVELQTG